MKTKHKLLLILAIILVAAGIIYKLSTKLNPNPSRFIGQELDSLNGVYVYYNGGIGNTEGRNLAPDGYNLGLKYQCVEFVKRYYYEHYHHKMPDSYGNAKDFFDSNVKDGGINKSRNLIQFSNPALSAPQVGDLIIFDGHPGNVYGHVAIVSGVFENEIEIIQQNPGPFADSRVRLGLKKSEDKYEIEHKRVLGWLRRKKG